MSEGIHRTSRDRNIENKVDEDKIPQHENEDDSNNDNNENKQASVKPVGTTRGVGDGPYEYNGNYTREEIRGGDGLLPIYHALDTTGYFIAYESA